MRTYIPTIIVGLLCTHTLIVAQEPLFLLQNSEPYAHRQSRQTSTNKCIPNPCVHGSCTVSGMVPEGFRCVCPIKYSGLRCDQLLTEEEQQAILYPSPSQSPLPASPSPSPTSQASHTPASAAPSPSTVPSQSRSPLPSNTRTAAPTPAPSKTRSPSNTPSNTPTRSPSAFASVTPSRSVSAVPTTSPTISVSPSRPGPVLGENVKIGKNVKFGAGVKVGSNVEFKDNAEVGDYVRVAMELIDEGEAMGLDLADLNDSRMEMSTRRRQAAGDDRRLSAPTEVGEGTKVQASSVVAIGVILGKDVAIGANTIIGSLAQLHDGVDIGDESVIGYNCTLKPDASVGDGVALGARARLESGSSIGDNSNVGSGFNLGVGSTVGENATIGIDNTLGDNVEIGSSVKFGPNSRVASGAVVESQVTLAENSFVDSGVVVPFGNIGGPGQKYTVKKEISAGIIAGIVVCALALALSVYLAVRLRKQHNQKKHYDRWMGKGKNPYFSESVFENYTAQDNTLRKIRAANSKYVPLENLFKESIIGSGKFGNVHRGVLKHQGALIPVAIKELRILEENSEEEVLREVDLMNRLDHPHVAYVLGVTKRLHQQIPCVVMEYLPLGSLYDYLKGRDGEYLPTTAVLALAHQLAEGMIYLESKGIVHRDLASRNCLLGPPTPDSHGVPILKVSDFGMSRILENVQVIVQSTDNKVQVMNPYLSMTTSMTTNSLGVLGESDPKTLSNRAGSSKRYKSKEYKKETYNQILRVGCTGNEGSDLLRQSSGDVVADFEGMGAFIPVPTPTGLYAQPASTHPQQHWGVSHGQHSMYSNSTSNTNNVSHTTIEKNRKSLRVAADTLMNNLVVVGDRILGIRRASWAPGQMEDRGVVEGSIHGPMPGQMHQNIQQSVMQPNNGQPFQQQLSYQRPPSYHQQQQQPYQGSPCYQEQPAYQESEQPQGQLQSYELHRQSLYNVPQQPRHQYMGRSSPVSQAGVDDEMGYLNINAKRLARGSKPVSQVGANEERGYINITAKHLAPEPLANKQKSSGPSYMGRNGGKVRLHQGPSTDALFMGVRESQAYTHSDEDTISSTEAITAARAMDVGAHTGEVSHTQTHSGVSPQVKPRPRPTSHGSSRGARRSSTASATHSISEQEEDGTSRSHTHMLGDHGTRSDEDGLGYASDAMRKSYASTPETGYKAHAHAHTHAHAHAHAHAHEDDEGYSEEGNEYMESGGDERANVPPITMAQMVGFKGHDLGMIDQATGECIDGTTCSGSVELLPNGRRPDSVISFNTCFPNFEDELKKEKGAYKDKEIFEVGDNAALPLRWMALESVQRHVFSTKSDVWSYGVVLWEIASLAALPYGPGDIHEILAKIETGYRLERPKHCPESLYDIMLSCWQEEPNDRPYFADIGENLSFTLGEIVRKRNLDNKSSGNRTGYISSCFDQDHLRSQYVMEAQAQAPAQAPAQRKQSQNLQQVASTGHYLQAAHLSMKPSESLSQAGPRVLHNVESSGNYLVATPNTPMVGDSDARAKFLYSFMEDETHSTPHVLGVGSNSSDTFHYYECGPVSNKNHRSSSMLYSNSNESGMGSSGTSLRGHQMSPRGPQLSPRVHTPPSAHMLSVERPHTYARPHIRGYDPDESPSSM